jgi:hypothetical protein
MKLAVKERILIAGIYPRESNIINQTIVKDISDKVKILQDEMKEINLKLDGGQFTWDNKKAVDKDVEFTDLELQLLKGQVDKLDKENKITMDILDLCLKIRGEQ